MGTILLISQEVSAQQPANDMTAPLHLMQPDYETPYDVPSKEGIVEVIDRIYDYLNSVTPPALIDKNSGEVITNYKKIKKDQETAFQTGDFRLTSYEWGVTYAGMLLASEVTEESKYADYTNERLKFLADIRPFFEDLETKNAELKHPMKRVLHPHALDDSGAVCAAMIKAKTNGSEANLDPLIRNFMDYISNGQYRLSDGTLARNRPMKNSLWLDDLFMSVPALAQMGSYSKDPKYFDDAVKQVLQFAQRMFNEEKGLFMHAYIVDSEQHPEFYWGRANGWAIMTMVELLEVLPENHKGRSEVLDLLKKHIEGLTRLQSGKGLWHQLLDRNDSYLETSASAIYTYAIARSINRGYVDGKAYGPSVTLAWNAITEKVNGKGQVEGTCVGTGMGFDPAFYYYRPVNVYAAHGYGPVLLAGAEMIALLQNSYPKLNDSAIQFYDSEIKTDGPIFGEK
ncbi:glycoside hydrolase family 88 protein [Euzebyella marina]|uniref:Glycoside hydrolase family 88 protein n=1 Tax=Euzebyella marina TaxID=1761453 RepID=A0A3G2L218_9FLAO|nr:glycoside hydrolase family 88 protein [Euzebyella marina]AYN66299.1 glycoside hydrolase family 88 protein [Euzebyella marina]